MGQLGKCYYGLCRTRVGHALLRGTVTTARRLGFVGGFRLPFDALSLDHSSLSGLAKLWSRIHWSPGDGMMPSDQLLSVYRLASTWPVDGATVELGSWVGLTTSYLATACKTHGKGKVYAVDTFVGTREGGEPYPSLVKFGGSTLNAFNEQIQRAGVSDIVEPLVGLSQDVALAYPGEPIRVLLIDADHSYTGIKGDFESWLPHLAPGGLIIFHDYIIHDVARYIDEEVRTNPAVKFSPGQIGDNIIAVTKRADTPSESVAVDDPDGATPTPSFVEV